MSDAQDDAVVAAATALGDAHKVAAQTLEADALDGLRVAAEEYGRIITPHVRATSTVPAKVPGWAVRFAQTLVNETVERARARGRS